LEQLKVDRRYGTSFYYLIFFFQFFFFTLRLSGLQHAAAICTAVITTTSLTLTYFDAFTFTLSTRYTTYVAFKDHAYAKNLASGSPKGNTPSRVNLHEKLRMA
jgi:hypothetical protein